MNADVQKATLTAIAQVAIDSVVPSADWFACLPAPPKGRCVVIGAGKASALMAAELNCYWEGVPLSGIVATRYGHGVCAGRVAVIEAGHPVPDENSERAARAMLDAVVNLSKDDLVISLISGGGSACCALPVEGIHLSQKQKITQSLLRSGASISEMNAVRKALSQVKGGQLAKAAAPARVFNLIVSDIPGDVPEDVASGPTIPDTRRPLCAQKILEKYGLSEWKQYVPLYQHKESNDDVSVEYKIVASARQALQRAAREAQKHGYKPVVLSDQFECDSQVLASIMAAIVKSAKTAGFPDKPPLAIISGGETSVTISGKSYGRGGRNTEFVLALMKELKNCYGVGAIAVDSDGIDGTEDAAGAFLLSDSQFRAMENNLDLEEYLTKHDSYSFFKEMGDLFITGPTLTNVNDIRIILVN